MTKAIIKQEDHTPMAFEEQRPDFISDSVRGQEGVGVDDVTIPRIVLLQDLSPQLKKSNPEHIEGSEVGQFFNNVTDELYGTSFIMVPVFFRKEYVIWKDRKHGGGFRGAFPTQIQAIKAMDQLEDKALCEVKDTGQHFILMVESGSTMGVPVIQEAVISLSGGTMASSRQLNSMVKMAGGDRFARAYKCSSTEVKGAKGAYQSFKFHPLGFVNETLFEMAEAMYEAIKTGERDVNRDEEKAAEKVVAEEF